MGRIAGNTIAGSTGSGGSMVAGEGQVWHSDALGLPVGDSLFVWDTTTNSLGVGIGAPLTTLHTDGVATFTGGAAPVSGLNGLHLHFDSDVATITATQSGTANRELIIQGTPLSLCRGGTSLLFLAASSRIGIGANFITPDGTCHVHTATAGSVAAPTVADDFTVENSGSGGISILTPASTVGSLNFGSPSNNDEGQITYTHGPSLNTGGMQFISSGAQRMDLDSVGVLHTVNAIHQGGNTFAVSSNTTTLGHRRVYGCTSTAAPRTLTLQTVNILRGSTSSPWVFTVKDESDAAGTNNITIDTQGAQLIDGAATFVISTDSGSVTMYSNGSNLFVIGTT